LRVALVLLPLLVIGLVALKASHQKKWHTKNRAAKSAAFDEYVALRDKVKRLGEDTDGNNDLAIKAAKLTTLGLDRSMAERLNRLSRDEEGAHRRGYGLWCELRGSQFLFWMQAQQWHETPQQTAQILWDACQETLKGLDEGPEEFTLVVVVDGKDVPKELWRGKGQSGSQPQLKLSSGEADLFMGKQLFLPLEKRK
jgi:hypothetical protein